MAELSGLFSLDAESGVWVRCNTVEIYYRTYLRPRPRMGRDKLVRGKIRGLGESRNRRVFSCITLAKRNFTI